REIAQYKNQLDSLLYSYASTLAENGNLISGDLKQRADQTVAQARAASAYPEITITVLKQHIDDLNRVLLDVGAAVYQFAGQPSVGDPAAPGAPVEASPPPEEVFASAEAAPRETMNDDATIIGDFDDTVITDYEAVD
ncbi:MAG: molecular chaperone DnaK, partial [Cyanobacteria bacterium P01_A01_bin.17]